MYENTPPGGPNGERLGTRDAESSVERARETLGGAGQALGDAARERSRRAQERARQAQEWARMRSTEAQQWARSQWGGLQHRVEEDPYRATLWSLGIGFIAGIVLSSLVRGDRD